MFLVGWYNTWLFHFGWCVLSLVYLWLPFRVVVNLVVWVGLVLCWLGSVGFLVVRLFAGWVS